MDVGFHYEDVPPQQWLDELHRFDIPGLFDIQLNNTQRTNLTARAKDQLQNWRNGLRDQIKKIEGRYDKDKQAAKERTLAPYLLLEQLGNDLNNRVRDLEKRIAAGRAVPQRFEFGTIIFGDMATKRWHLGHREDEKRWDDFMATERRFKSMTEEYRRQSQGLKNANQRVREYQEELRAIVDQYKLQNGCLYLGIKLITVLLLAALGLLVGAVAFFADFQLVPTLSNQAFGGTMLVISVIAAITAVIFARRRRARIAALKADIVSMRATLKELKDEALRHKKLFYPTQQTYKEVRQDYKILNETF